MDKIDTIKDMMRKAEERLAWKKNGMRYFIM